jgi:hypothetical protein
LGDYAQFSHVTAFVGQRPTVGSTNELLSNTADSKAKILRADQNDDANFYRLSTNDANSAAVHSHPSIKYSSNDHCSMNTINRKRACPAKGNTEKLTASGTTTEPLLNTAGGEISKTRKLWNSNSNDNFSNATAVTNQHPLEPFSSHGVALHGLHEPARKISPKSSLPAREREEKKGPFWDDSNNSCPIQGSTHLETSSLGSANSARGTPSDALPIVFPSACG